MGGWIVFLANGPGITGYSYIREWSWTLKSYPLPKLITNDQTLKYDSWNYKNFLKVGVYLHDLGLGSGFSRWHQKHKNKRETDTFDFIKIENLCALKDTVIKVKEQSTDGRKCL